MAQRGTTRGRQDPADAAEEERWVWRLRKGEPEALDHFAARHWAGLVAFAYDLVGSMDGAKDLAQEAFLRLWERRKSFEGRGSIRNYLLQTVRRLVLNEARDRRLRERPDVAERVRETLSAPPLPDVSAERRDLEAAIEEALRALPPRRREALVLVRFHGLSIREAAEVMGSAPQTVANQVTTALRELRERLAPYLEVRGRPDEGA